MSNRQEQTPLHVLEMGTQFGVGGITRHILNLQEWLTARGHRVTLGGTADVWAGPGTVPHFLDLPTRWVAADGGGVVSRLWQTLIAVRQLRAWLAENPVDLIHAHESAPALVALLALWGRKTPLVLTYHGAEPERIRGFGRIARRADLVITPSHRSAEDLVAIGRLRKAQLRVIGLGLPPAPPDSAEEVAALRARLLDGGDRVIVTIARLLHQKGIDVLIDCVARLKESHPRWRFVLVGDGPDEDALQDLAHTRGLGQHLNFVGRSARPHLFLRAADLFLLTSRWEALPFTIVEALQTGTPVVATACSGVVELVDESVGRTVPIGDVAAICAAIEGVLSDEAARGRMSAAALERSREDRFDPDWVHARFEQTYYELARPGGAR